MNYLSRDPDWRLFVDRVDEPYHISLSAQHGPYAKFSLVVAGNLGLVVLDCRAIPALVDSVLDCFPEPD